MTVTSDSARPDRPLRADAERNRRLILDVAGEVFAERGLDAGFDEVARRAGVGVGTVYRRFPDREDLIDALFAERIEGMAELAEEAGRVDDPWEAVVFFLERSIEAQAVDRGLMEVLGQGVGRDRRIERARDRMQPLVGALVRRAAAAGALRPGVQPLDLAVLASGLARISTDGRPDLWRRYLPVVLDGLRPAPGQAGLPLAAPDEAEFAMLVHDRWR